MEIKLNRSQEVSALTKAARALADEGRKESAVAILSSAPLDDMDADLLSLLNSIKRARGVSVVMPTYNGVERIDRALKSLASQTLDPNQFEVIVVQNGDDDGTAALIKAFRKSHPQLRITVANSHPAGAGIARNHGCALAAFDHITFLDDDDFLSPDFLAALLELADGKSIVFSQIADFDDQGGRESSVNKALLGAFSARSRLKTGDAPAALTALTMTCIKLFPSYIPEMVKFDPALPNGEDVVFWTEALARFDPDLMFAAPERNAIYHREVRGNSISRQQTSFKFNIVDRIEVAKRIDLLHKKYPKKFVKDKLLSAAYFMAAYLREHPQDHSRVFKELDANRLPEDMKSYINRSLSKTLAVSYCFPPWADTAGTVAAKRMVAAGQPFDVISNEMGKFRSLDKSLNDLAHHLVGDHIELKTPTNSTVDPKGCIEFARQAKKSALNLNSARKFEKMYSRVMWPASNFAAASIKAALPKIFWTAEFSDPMVTDIVSARRPGKMEMAWLSETGIDKRIVEKGYPLLESDSLMEWCEYLAYTLADEVLFTNKNQRDYMLSQPWISNLAPRILKKSIIAPHPTLSPAFYEKSDDFWRPQPDRINIAYFGSFYKTRGLSSILEAISTLDDQIKSKVHLDIYAAHNADLQNLINDLGISMFVKQQEPLSYFRFLARCKTYDFLLVNDAETRGIKPMNPYLPSKVSDYLGAGVPIWAVAEKDSSLYHTPLPKGSIVSELGDPGSYSAALKAISLKEADLVG